jgi:hypothetical protein
MRFPLPTLLCASNSSTRNSREDGYADKGNVISAPWKAWMAGLHHSYDYASIITAFPTDDYDQGWHRDTPDDKESSTVHQVAP